MTHEQDLLARYSDDFNKLYKKRKIILSFEDFISLASKKPKLFIRDASHYITDVFSYHGNKEAKHLDLLESKKFLLFELFSENQKKLVGCEKVQNEIFHSLSKFKRKGFVDKLILLYGPSASSKSLSIEKIASAMEHYSRKKEGAVYKFNWIFPINLESHKRQNNFPQKIGFNSDSLEKDPRTFAFLNENQILAKIQSEFKENPLFLLPMPHREEFLRNILAKKEGKKEEDIFIPPHLLSNGLSKKNQEILENMLHIYNGDLKKVFRHVQVERFFYSSQYRVGISSIDPHASMDAYEKQVTIDGNYHKLPPYLQDINFHESYGELVEANRGLVEYSDFLSRPLAAIKQLLNTIERRYIKLSSSIAQLDLVYMAKADDKHMDAFKATPEFNSFRGRFEAIRVPYLLRPSEEIKIYKKDLEGLKKEISICPYTLELLVLWAVMTRLKPCLLGSFEAELHPLLERLGPREKIKLYEGESLSSVFTSEEEKKLIKMRQNIWETSGEGSVYEGRFGPSPRDVLALLHKASQRAQNNTLTPMDLFCELEDFIKQKSVYEYLKYEPHGVYHSQKDFLNILKNEYAQNFEEEMAQAMSIANKKEYILYLERYIKNVVAYLKNEKIWNSSANVFEEPSRELMFNVEEIFKITENTESFRSHLLNKIAAYKIENPGEKVKVSELFASELNKIKNYFFLEQRKIVELNYNLILANLNPKSKNLMSEGESKKIIKILSNMEGEYGYTKESIYRSIKFVTRKSGKKKTQPLAPICPEFQERV